MLDTASLLEAAPALDGFVTRLDGEGALEVDVEKGQGLNEVFVQLDRLGIKVVSMRTKANRLEELFIRMVQENAAESRKGLEGVA